MLSTVILLEGSFVSTKYKNIPIIESFAKKVTPF